MPSNEFTVKFHGVRGSIPSPLINEEVEGKLVQALQKAEPEDLANEGSIKSFVQSLPLEIRGTFGGNSSCVTMRVDDELLIFDAGSGIRMLGQELMATEFAVGRERQTSSFPILIGIIFWEFHFLCLFI